MKLIEKTIYLASTSPRRKELLERICADIKIIDPSVNESIPTHAEHGKLAISIAKIKIDEAIKLCPQGNIIITADTIVSVDDLVLGKPKDKTEAKEMLMLLSGNTHFVYTGFCIYNPRNKKVFSKVVKTEVTFNKLNMADVDLYIASKGPFDKAGGYGIQDSFGSVFVKSIKGCYYNVVGFPISEIYTHLRGII